MEYKKELIKHLSSEVRMHLLGCLHPEQIDIALNVLIDVVFSLAAMTEDPKATMTHVITILQLDSLTGRIERKVKELQ